MLLEQHLKRVERHFLQRKRIQSMVDDIKAERVAKKELTGGARHAFISDPTAITAIKNVAPIISIKIDMGVYEMTVFHPEDWLAVIDATYLLHKNQLTGTAMWARCEEGKSPAVVWGLMGISERCYYNWREEFLSDAIVLAIEKGLIVFNKTEAEKSAIHDVK